MAKIKLWAVIVSRGIGYDRYVFSHKADAVECSRMFKHSDNPVYLGTFSDMTVYPAVLFDDISYTGYAPKYLYYRSIDEFKHGINRDYNWG